MRVKEIVNIIKEKRHLVEEGIWSIAVIENESPVFSRNMNSCRPVITANSITDRKAEFVADPFLFEEYGKLYLFYEILDFITSKGVIGVSESQDGVVWDYKGVILEENYHLSYPQVFKEENNYYMIPESHESGEVRVYKAKKFPEEWEIEKVILRGRYLDNSLFKYKDKWWMFNESIEKDGTKNLRLFYSKFILGEWKEHPKSPLICNDLSITRPAGNVVEYKDEIYRFSQDCSERYGKNIIAFKITNLNEEDYQEESVGIVLSESKIDKSWNKDGTHTINSVSNNEGKIITCSDGYYLKRKNLITQKIKREISKIIYR